MVAGSPHMEMSSRHACTLMACAQCRQFQSDYARAHGRRRAQQRLPAEVRQRLLDAIYAGRPFRAVLGDLGLSSKVFGLAKTDNEWGFALEHALTAVRQDDLEHGLMRRMCRAVSAASVGRTSVSGWPATCS